MLRDSLASFQYSFSDLKGMKTLITGENGVGKSALLRRLLGEAHDETREKITVLDFASLEFEVDGVISGGHLTDKQASNIRIISSKLIKTPWHSAKNADDLTRLADYNHNITQSLLDQYMSSPTNTLFINDVSVHLLRGTLQKLWDSIRKTETVIASGYLGNRTTDDFGTGISRRENLLIRRLSAKMDRVISL